MIGHLIDLFTYNPRRSDGWTVRVAASIVVPVENTDPALLQAKPPLRQVAWFFLKLGTIAFGGPAAHIALMEDQIVHRYRWMNRQDFLDLLGAANLLPGPSSTELAIYIGFRLAGLAGLLLAGVCFILPAALMVTALAWAYLRYHTTPPLQGVLYITKPLVVAIVLQALWRLRTTGFKSRWMVLIAACCGGLLCLKTPPFFVLLVGAVLGSSPLLLRSRVSGPPLLTLAPLPTLAALNAVTQGSILLAFLKLGCVVFGSGYVLLAFLQHDLVDQRHWLTPGELLDAVAIGQVTPGPVFTTATFIGYLLGGPAGALAATVGIFLPAFVLVGASGPLIARLRRSPIAGAALDGVNAASLALMAVVASQLSRTAIVDALTLATFLVSAWLLIRMHLNTTWLILLAIAVGLVWSVLSHK